MANTQTTAGEQLDQIGQDLDRTGAAWKTAEYPDHGPTFEAREAVYDRLRAWNQRQAGPVLDDRGQVAALDGYQPLNR